LRILVVHPGADFSTHDVWQGIVGSLRYFGAEVIQLALDNRLAFASKYLSTQYEIAKEHNAKVATPTQADIQYLASVGAIERALRHEVDWVLVISAMYFHPDVMVMLRRAGIPVALILTESPYDDEWQAPLAEVCDVVWTNERSRLPTFEAINPNTHYWQHAYDPARHHPGLGEEEEVAAHDVVMVGTGFEERIELLQAVNWEGIDLGLYGTWELLPDDDPLSAYIRGGFVPNETTAALYRQAKIGLNIHRLSVGFGESTRRIGYAESLGPRCYELAACGTFFISDYREELSDVFGDAVPTYRTPEELEDKVRYYLAHDAERERLRGKLAGCLVGHTFHDRVRDVLRVLDARGRRAG